MRQVGLIIYKAHVSTSTIGSLVRTVVDVVAAAARLSGDCVAVAVSICLYMRPVVLPLAKMAAKCRRLARPVSPAL